jgi:Asp-tRNA(Asn)/Glu-tRNA(Gln) amidotransferase A subunit family amidase
MSLGRNDARSSRSVRAAGDGALVSEGRAPSLAPSDPCPESARTEHEVDAGRRGLLRVLAAGTAIASAPAAVRAAGADAAPPLPDRAQRGSGVVTAATIAAAEKLHALSFTPAQRELLARTVPENIAALTALRAVSKPRDLMPALTFDPRLPGRTYGPAGESFRLAVHESVPIPRDDRAIALAAVREQADWLRTKQITSRRLTEIYLSRISRIAPRLHCFITVTAERARADADRADRELANGKDLGLLHGIPYGIKDTFDTAGIPTTWGAAAFKDRVPDRDAAVVQRLQAAGGVLLGKVSMGNLAFGSEWFGGDTRNPWNLEESSGGSSAGSGSATAAGLVSYSIGTDSLGSILNPSDRCGVVGLRTTFGRISTRDAMPLTPSLSRIGPITRSVEDAAIVLAVLNGADAGLSDSIGMAFAYDAALDLRSLRVGYLPDALGSGATQRAPTGGSRRNMPASPPQVGALKAIRDLGATLVELKFPDLPYAALTPLLYCEAAAVFEDLTLSGRDETLVAGEAGAGWPNTWRQARLFSAVDYVQADRVRRLVMEAMDRVFSDVDVICGPLYGGGMDTVIATNFTGHPGLTMRVGFIETPSRAIMGPVRDPAGPRRRVTQNITLHGRLFEEGTLLALGGALERRLDVWRQGPDVG